MDKTVFAFSFGRGMHSVPKIGFGTASLNGDTCVTAVKTALQTGYRMVDTALLYGNQVEVGEAIKASGVDRADIWLTSKVSFFPAVTDSATKLWMYNENNLKGQEPGSIDLSLQQLGVSYVDLMLIHNPCASALEYNAASLPHFFEYFKLYHPEKAFNPSCYADGEPVRPALLEHKRNKLRAPGSIDYSAGYSLRKQAWANMEAAQAAGKCKFIGVSNYPAELLEEMQSYAKVMPQFNQLEMHPRYASPKLREVAARLGVTLIGYGCASAMQIDLPAAVGSAAADTGLTAVQVCQRWMMQQAVIPLVRSKDPTHIAENFRVLTGAADNSAAAVQLSEEQLAAIDAEDRDYPYYWDPCATVLSLGSDSSK